MVQDVIVVIIQVVLVVVVVMHYARADVLVANTWVLDVLGAIAGNVFKRNGINNYLFNRMIYVIFCVLISKPFKSKRLFLLLIKIG